MSDDAHRGDAVPSPGRGWIAWVLPVLVALAIGAAQGRAEPLADDWEVIVNLDRLGFVRAILEDTEATNMRFRPVGYGHLWVERAFLGLSFGAVRWIGIAVLGVVGGLVGALVRRLGGGHGRSVAAAVLFVCLPFHTEVYGWACTRDGVVAAGLGIGGLLCAHARRPAAATALLLAAYLSKEYAYPLAFASWFLLLGRGGSRRIDARGLAAAASGGIALALALAAKAWAVGALVAREWVVEVPWSVRLEGYLTHLVALATRPASAEAPGWAGGLGWAFTAVLWTAVLAGAAARLRRRGAPAVELARPATARASRGAAAASPERGRLAVVLVLLVIALGCLTVPGGLPAHADMQGSRFWFLPAAFGVAALASWVRTPWLVLLACLGAPLLHANLAPYREASRRMGVVLDRLAAEVPARERAVRIAELERMRGPVSLFELMTTFYMLRFDTEAPEDRPFLTLASPLESDHARIAATDARWRAWMEAQGRAVLDLVWDAEAGELVEAR